MTRPVLTFFNNKGGVGKTTLVYHVAWMLQELGRSVVVLDLDPQTNLTASFLSDERVEQLWTEPSRRSVYGALAPLFEGEGGIREPHVEEIAFGLSLVPGDLRLSGAEQELSFAWANSLDRQVRAFRVTAAFATIAQQAAELTDSEIVLADVGPNLGAINRAAMVASDHVVVPLAPDLYSLQGLRNLGPTLGDWRQGWADVSIRKCRERAFRWPAWRSSSVAPVMVLRIRVLTRAGAAGPRRGGPRGWRSRAGTVPALHR